VRPSRQSSNQRHDQYGSKHVLFLLYPACALMVKFSKT
jgi:hypothetical protein